MLISPQTLGTHESLRPFFIFNIVIAEPVRPIHFYFITRPRQKQKIINTKTPSDLNLHLIVDNYGTHKHPRVQRWLKRHPRFYLHFTPTSSSWLNLVERWFSEITTKRIRRGSFRNVKELIIIIKQYIESHNQNPHVFVWSAPVERILTKIAKCKEVLDALH